MKKKAIVISAFTGTGRNYFINNTDLKVLNLNTRDFAYTDLHKRNPNFPNNFVSCIKDNLDKYGVILLPSDDITYQSLVNKSIDYNIVFPSINLRNAYESRLRDKGVDEYFINIFLSTWEDEILKCGLQKQPKKIKLTSEDHYLSDIIKSLIEG